MWFPPNAAANKFGCKPRTLRERFQNNPEAFVRDERGYYWIAVDGEGDEPPETEPAQAALEVAPATATTSAYVKPSKPAPAPASDEPTAHEELGRIDLSDIEKDTEEGSSYQYVPRGVPNGDRYIFALRSKSKTGRPTVLAGDDVRALVQAYSNDGGKATLNEIARSFGLHRVTVREILRALGKTHDSAPFTDEEIAEGDVDTLGEDVLRAKEEKILRIAERRSWDETKRLAEKARHFDKFVAERIENILATEGMPKVPESVSAPSLPRAPSPFTAVFGLTDLHFGAAGWRDEVGHETSREIVRERALVTTRRLIARVLRFGAPSCWLMPAGSDNFHADTDLGTTTKGTPLDMDGSFARVFLEGCSLYEELICLLRTVAPVEIVAMPGNHDRLAAMMLTHWLSARFREARDVKVGSPVEHRSYHLHGKSLIAFTHGDEIKEAKIPLLMATEASEAWGKSKHRIAFGGHWHTDKSNEFNGVRVQTMPSLANCDRYHWRNAYSGNTKAIAAYLIDHDEGLTASLPVQPEGARE